MESFKVMGKFIPMVISFTKVNLKTGKKMVEVFGLVL